MATEYFGEIVTDKKSSEAKPYDGDVILEKTKEEPSVFKDILTGTARGTGEAAPYIAAARLGKVPGVLGVAGYDIATGLYGAAAPKEWPRPLSSAELVRKAESAIGVPEPTTVPGRIAEAGTAGAMSAFGMAKGLSSIPVDVMGQRGRLPQLIEALSASPVLQAASGGGAGIGAQTAKEMNRPPEEQFLAAMGGGIFPGVLPAVAGLLKYPSNRVANLFFSMIGKPQEAERVSAKTQAEVSKLRGTAAPGEPAMAVSGALQQEAARIENASRTRAAQIEALAQQEKERILSEGAAKAGSAAAEEQQRAIKQREVIPKLRANVDAASKSVEDARVKLGTPATETDVGQQIRDAAVNRQQQLVSERQQAFDTTKRERDAVVMGKESRGEYVEAMPEFKGLLKWLDDKLLIGRAKIEKKTASVTDQEQLTALNRVRDAILGRRIPVDADQIEKLQTAGVKIIKGTDPRTGAEVFYRDYPSSFQAIDDLRRKLGAKAKYGEETSGYEAIGSHIANQLYGKISEIQKKFAGSSQEKLLRDYAEGKHGELVFGTREGKALTKTTPIGEEYFNTPAGSLPGMMFKAGGRDQVMRAIEATGNKAVVEEAARKHMAQQLQDKSPKAIDSWIKENDDWLKLFPDLKKDAQSFSSSLFGLEKTSKAMEGAVERMKGKAAKSFELAQTRPAEITKEAEKTAEARVAAGAKEAATVQSDAAKLADTLRVKPSDAPSIISGILQKGYTQNQLNQIVGAIKNNPQAMNAFPDALRQNIASIPPRNMLTKWDSDIKHIVKGLGLMTTEQFNTLDKQIRNIDKTMNTAAKSRVISALVYSAMTANRAMQAARLSQ